MLGEEAIVKICRMDDYRIRQKQVKLKDEVLQSARQRLSIPKMLVVSLDHSQTPDIPTFTDRSPRLEGPCHIILKKNDASFVHQIIFGFAKPISRGLFRTHWSRLIMISTFRVCKLLSLANPQTGLEPTSTTLVIRTSSYCGFTNN